MRRGRRGRRGREGEREGRREGGKERGREGEREGRREGGRANEVTMGIGIFIESSNIPQEVCQSRSAPAKCVGGDRSREDEQNLDRR